MIRGTKDGPMNIYSIQDSASMAKKITIFHHVSTDWMKVDASKDA